MSALSRLKSSEYWGGSTFRRVPQADLDKALAVIKSAENVLSQLIGSDIVDDLEKVLAILKDETDGLK